MYLGITTHSYERVFASNPLIRKISSLSINDFNFLNLNYEQIQSTALNEAQGGKITLHKKAPVSKRELFNLEIRT